MGLRILVLPWGHALSHVSRPLRLAEQLRRRGHELVFAGEGPQLVHAEQKGFPVHRTREIPADRLLSRIRARRLRFVEADELWDLVEADLRLYREVRPDLVLTDGRVSARLSCLAAGLPHAAIVNVSSTHHRAIPYVPLFEWVRPVRARARMRRFNLWAEMLVFDAAVPAFRIAARRLGVAPVVTATNCLEGNDLTLLPDIPEFMPSRGLPEGHHYIGPLTFDGSHLQDPPWWPELMNCKQEGREVIYFTLGTTGVRKLFEQALEYFRARPDEAAVVTTGGQADLPSPPANVFVARVLDGDRVMRVADFVVCHGGNGTVYQALRHGVPIIGIPTVPDQMYNVRRVESLGVGVRLRGALTARSLMEARQVALNARSAARDIQRVVEGCSAVVMAVSQIERVASRRSSFSRFAWGRRPEDGP